MAGDLEWDRVRIENASVSANDNPSTAHPNWCRQMDAVSHFKFNMVGLYICMYDPRISKGYREQSEGTQIWTISASDNYHNHHISATLLYVGPLNPVSDDVKNLKHKV